MPRVFISYSHDSEPHRESVRALCERLRQSGIDAWIDQYDEVPPPTSWPRWMYDQIEQSDFVLLVVTETYARRVLGRERPGVGLGATWEGAIITQEVYETSTSKFVPVLIGSDAAEDVPYFLRSTTRYVVHPETGAGMESLTRRLLNRPLVVPPSLGVEPVLAPKPAATPQQTEAAHDDKLRAAADEGRGVRPSMPRAERPTSAWTAETAAGVAATASAAAFVSLASDRDTAFFHLRRSVTSLKAFVETVTKREVRVSVLDVFARTSGELNARLIMGASAASDVSWGPEGAALRVVANTDLRTVIESGEPYVSQDVTASIGYENSHWRAGTTPYRACFVLPLAVDGPDGTRAMRGFLAIDSAARNVFEDATLRAAVQNLAVTLTAALEHIAQLAR